MSEPFDLSPEPLPSKRTIQARRERETLAFQRSRIAYLSVREIKRAILRGGNLAQSRLDEIGVPSLFALLLRLRKDLRRLLRHYEETSIRALFSKHYGRTPPYFQFHHEMPPREFDMENEEERKECCNVANLRLVTAEENLAIEARKRRGEDDPRQHWLL